MADTIAVTFDLYKAARIGSTPMGLISGTVNLSVYSQTKTALAALTGKFLTGGLLRVVPDGISSLGYMVRWSKADSAFRVYGPGAITPALAAPGAAAAITPPSSAAAYTNADAVPITVIITGGTSTHAVIGRTNGSFTSADVATVNPIVAHLDVGDTLTVTYSVAGTWTKLPFGAVTASAAAAAAEVANSTNVGTFDFIAMGQMG